MDDETIPTARKRRGRMKAVNDMDELLDEASNIVERYRRKNSASYMKFKDRKKQAESFYQDLNYTESDVYDSYFQSTIDWGAAIFDFYWGLGVAAAVSEYQQPDMLFQKDAELLYKLENPVIPGLDKLERTMNSRYKKMRGLLPDDDKPLLDEHLLLSKQEAWDNAPFAFVQGHEEGLRILRTTGFKENAANLEWLYWEYLPK